MTEPAAGWIMGYFEPLHQGHIRLIQHAMGIVDCLYVIILEHTTPNPRYPVTLADKARWLQKVFQPFPFVKIHTYAGEMPHSKQSAPQETLNHIRRSCAVPDHAKFIADESNPLLALLPPKHCIALRYHHQYPGDAIRANPARYWHYIHPIARRNYTRTVAIVGGESSGKTTLVHKLANHFTAGYALEQGRLYVDYALGGSELALQYSDYRRISIDHAEAIFRATDEALAPVTLIDTDFITTQAFCLTYEGKTDPIVAAFAERIRFNHTLLLANNTVWVDDGMRSLGSLKARTAFQNTLCTLYQEYGITYHPISSKSYEERYQQAVKYIEQHIYT